MPIHRAVKHLSEDVSRDVKPAQRRVRGEHRCECSTTHVGDAVSSQTELGQRRVAGSEGVGE